MAQRYWGGGSAGGTRERVRALDEATGGDDLASGVELAVGMRLRHSIRTVDHIGHRADVVDKEDVRTYRLLQEGY